MNRARQLATAAVFTVALLLATPALAAPAAPMPSQAPSAADPETWGCSGDDLDLGTVAIEHAPVNPEASEADGSDITPSAAADGGWVPVIMVHGWTARSTHPNADGTEATSGTFSKNIDLTANRSGDGADAGRSLVGQLQGLPGAAVFTYDYHEYSGRWVTDEHIGPGLAQVINCLAEAAGNPAVVIGHSMGGLAARDALTDPDAVTNTAAVITLGTPHSGSDLANWVSGQKGKVDVLIGSLYTTLMSQCARVTTKDIDAGGVCGLLPDFLAAFDGDAGRALRTGSDEINALPSIPEEVPLYTLGGQTSIDVRTRYGWFGVPFKDDPADVGDIVVATSSAHPETASNEPYVNECTYQLIPAGPTDQIATDLKLVTEQDKSNNLWTEARGPCFHTNLPRDIQITNEIMGLTSDAISDIVANRKFTVPAYCDQEERGVAVGESIVPTSIGGDGYNWLSTPTTWDTGEETVLVADIVCSAGGVSWPGVLLFYDARTRERLDEIFLSNIEPSATQGVSPSTKQASKRRTFLPPTASKRQAAAASQQASLNCNGIPTRVRPKLKAKRPCASPRRTSSRSQLPRRTSCAPASSAMPPRGCSAALQPTTSAPKNRPMGLVESPPNYPLCAGMRTQKSERKLDGTVGTQRLSYLSSAKQEQSWEMNGWYDRYQGAEHAVLPYDTTVVWEDLTSSAPARPPGSTATNALTGTGFKVSRAAFETF